MAFKNIINEGVKQIGGSYHCQGFNDSRRIFGWVGGENRAYDSNLALYMDADTCGCNL